MNDAKICLVIRINEESDTAIEVFPSSKTTADIFIAAKSMTEAKEMITEAEAIAAIKMRNYVEKPKQTKEKPEEQPKNKEHFKVASVSEEEASRRIEEYKKTPSGKRFYKEIDNGMSFIRKKDKGLSVIDAGYLALEAYTHDPYTAILYSYDLAYKRGYSAGKREEKAKHSNLKQ